MLASLKVLESFWKCRKPMSSKDFSGAQFVLRRWVNTEMETLPRKRTVRSVYQKKQRDLGPMAWFLLVIPVSAFGLGTWQVSRKKWKENLISDLKARTALEPVDYPLDLSEISAMEYHPVRVRGTFDHSKELYIGPRSLMVEGDSQNSQGIISSVQSGFQVITPFTLSDRDLTILVNRGWVPQKSKNPEKRKMGQVKGEVELVGLVRLTEGRQPLMPENKPNSGLWLYRDLGKMSAMVGAAPLFIDAVAETTVSGGPIAGQTRVSLRNEHLSYILTWYGLSVATAFMWFQHFIRRAPSL